MKIGVSAFAWTAEFDPSQLDLLLKIRENGLTGFEIPMFDPAKLDVSRIRRAFEASDLDCTVCAILPDGINPISPDASVRMKSQQHLVRCVETAAACGARLLGGPLYAPIGYLPKHRRTSDEWLWAVEAFQALGELLDAYRITLAIEPVNRSETFFLRTAKEARAFCEAVGHPGVGVTIDTFHANIEELDVAGAVGLLGHHLQHLHASENDRGLLGKGHVNFPELIAVLKKSGYDGYLMIEGFGYARHEMNAPGALWADVSVSPEDIAFEGARYLRSLLESENLASI